MFFVQPPCSSTSDRGSTDQRPCCLSSTSDPGFKKVSVVAYFINQCDMKVSVYECAAAQIKLGVYVVAAGEVNKEQCMVGMAKKVMVVLSSLAAVEEGKAAIVDEGGVQALVEVIKDGASVKEKEFAVVTLLQLCEGVNGARIRGLLVGEGVILLLVALSQTVTAIAKQKAETLLWYVKEARQEGCSSSLK
ncbi:hypothetical protein QVD17_08904 [Tagetes erecta]|uniref:Uncharacterized protein n=1 Tax=Tagetes erecta TaxID=13708 RepID=A0AAD8L396_TARER|nr:hypothetical protein QVD17_08904 [Tagetes erecta]